MAETKQTFWNIMTEHQIEIPVIQRDYAQGRVDSKVKGIREGFVKVLINALENSTELHLDFIYGRVFGKEKELIQKQNREAIERVLGAVRGYAHNLDMDIEFKINKQLIDEVQKKATKLEPLDGQQRLTTLFLLHLYLVIQASDNKNNDLNSLNGFQYRTRKTTTEFCNFLTNLEDNFIFSSDESVFYQLEKNSMFFSYWKKDPSVKGMLVMLDTIHNKLKGKSVTQLSFLYNNLINDNKITFDFLDLDKMEQTDELYVKMNARGKHLNHFEHFKAFIQEKAEAPINFWEKLDTTWIDFFWIKKKKNVFKIDNTIFYFLKNVNLFHYIVNTKEPDSKFIDSVRKAGTKKASDDFIPLQEFTKQEFFNTNSLQFTANTLDALIKLEKQDIDYTNIFHKTFTRKSRLLDFLIEQPEELGYDDTVYYYCLLLYIANNPNNDLDYNVKELHKWMHLCRNLVYNTYIQNPKDFINAIKGAYTLFNKAYVIDKTKSINIWMKSTRVGIEFYKGQFKEEILKLTFIEKGENWKIQIYKLENHPYFSGQMGFMFNLLNDKNDLNEFVRKTNILTSIFDDSQKNNFEFQRALLSIDNYLNTSTSTQSLYTTEQGGLRGKNDNWRKIFNDENKLVILKKLIDRIDNGETLQQIIDKSTVSDNWKKMIINCPDVFKYSNVKLLKFYDDKNIHLLYGKTLNGKNVDLPLYYLFKVLLKKQHNEIKFLLDEINNGKTSTSYAKIHCVNNAENTQYFSISYHVTEEFYGFKIDYTQPGAIVNLEGVIELERIDKTYKFIKINEDTDIVKLCSSISENIFVEETLAINE
jgi:hypothetical protein